MQRMQLIQVMTQKKHTTSQSEEVETSADEEIEISVNQEYNGSASTKNYDGNVISPEVAEKMLH